MGQLGPLRQAWSVEHFNMTAVVTNKPAPDKFTERFGDRFGRAADQLSKVIIAQGDSIPIIIA
jgi:hypothetical protein